MVLIGDRLVDHADMLHKLLQHHQRLYVNIIPLCKKPKLHFALHLAECVKEHVYNVSLTFVAS